MFKGIKYDLTTILPGPLVENADPASMLGVTDLSNYTEPLLLEQSIGWSPLYASNLESYRGIYFKHGDYFYAVGGRSTGNLRTNKIFYSSNLLLWAEHTSITPWGTREGMAYCYHRGAHYAFGGYDGATSQRDVWRSVDGVNWTQIYNGPILNQGYLYTMFSYKTNLYICGEGDVFKSTDDGVSWTLIQAAAAFGNQTGMAGVVFKDKMYLICGFIGGVAQNNAYSSTDGILWTLESALVFPSIRGSIGAVVQDNMIIVTGGTSAGTYYDDARYSLDGVTWVDHPSSGIHGERAWHGMIAHDNKYYLYGGYQTAGFESRADYYNLGTDYYLNGVYVDRTDPDVQIYSDGYYEMQALYGDQIKLARFCFTASGAWKAINLYNTKTVPQFKGNTLARPATFKRITLTAPWTIKFTCRADYAPGEVLGDSVTGNSIQVYPDPSIRIDTGAGFVTLAINLDSDQLHNYVLLATNATDVQVYQDSNLEGTIVLATTTISLDTLGGGANGVAATNQGYMYNLMIESGGIVLYAPMDESLVQLTDQFIDHSANENHIQVSSSGIMATDTLPINGSFTGVFFGWNQYLPFNSITVVNFGGRTDVLRVDASVAANYFYQSMGLRNGAYYEMSFYAYEDTAQPRCIIGSSPGDTDLLNSGYVSTVGWELKTFTFMSPDDQGYLAFDCNAPGIYYIDALTLREASVECQVIPNQDVTSDAIAGTTLRVYNATTQAITEYTVRNSAYSNSNLTKIFTTTALATSSGVTLASIKEAVDTGLSEMLMDFNSNSIAPRSIVKSLARANISKLTDKLGSKNEIDINVVSPVIISIYDGELLIDKVVAGNPNFDNNYQVKVIQGRKIAIWDDSAGVKQLDKYLTYSGV